MPKCYPEGARLREAVFTDFGAICVIGALTVIAFLGCANATSPAMNTVANRMQLGAARCLIGREAPLVDRWLKTLPGSDSEAQLVEAGEARFSACFPQPLSPFGGVWLPTYNVAGMRAALVRALLQARRDRLPSAAPEVGGPETFYTETPNLNTTPENNAAIVGANLATCLARKHWSDILALIKAVDPAVERNGYDYGRKFIRDAVKREELDAEAALNNIIPSIGGCVPAGTKLRIERVRLRSLLEEAAYQLSVVKGRSISRAEPADSHG